ncbi:syntaxin-12 [Scaptodrosophila lebanonensis]|uniref:Syntaxin-12 n=1 Tax=Drosophila lebanonensis TaxID=7225 RepID=A0A6J2UES3_DROLE|nr:syntaxin-12 [Scaptodrosophila lebanonensis]
MSHALNNSAGTSHRDYGSITTSTTVTPEVSFVGGFSPTEFMSLSEDIAHNINAINSSTKQLEKALKNMDSSSVRDKVHKINSKTKEHVETTTSYLQRLATVVPRGDQQQKLQLDKLKGDFESVVKKYSALQRNISTSLRRSYLLQEEIARGEAEESAQGNSLKKHVEQEEMARQLVMMKEREKQLILLEEDVLDVQQIMAKLSMMVHQQGESVGVVETVIGQTAANVEEGRLELAKAERSHRSQRRKILILLAIAVIIGLIVTIIIVSKLS